MLKLNNVNCSAGNFSLKNISLSIAKDDYFVVLGPTGSGKTTLAKCICGLLPVESGKILLNNINITNQPPNIRSIGYLPQDFALFPHLNVLNNILFGIQVRNIKFAAVKNKFETIISKLKIEHLLNREIYSLSGGEKQRVAFARAVMAEPVLLILDEPFSAIDMKLKTDLWFEMRSFFQMMEIPVIHITHNLDEAAVLSDRILILKHGKIEYIGSKNNIFYAPETENIARYVGIRNIYTGIVENIINNKIIVKNRSFTVKMNYFKDVVKGQSIKFGINAKDINVMPYDSIIDDNCNVFAGIVKNIHFLSDSVLVKVLAGDIFEVNCPVNIYRKLNLQISDKVKIKIPKHSIFPLK